jgi:hypothetical protein
MVKIDNLALLSTYANVRQGTITLIIQEVCGHDRRPFRLKFG